MNKLSLKKAFFVLIRIHIMRQVRWGNETFEEFISISHFSIVFSVKYALWIE